MPPLGAMEAAEVTLVNTLVARDEQTLLAELHTGAANTIQRHARGRRSSGALRALTRAHLGCEPPNF